MMITVALFEAALTPDSSIASFEIKHLLPQANCHVGAGWFPAGVARLDGNQNHEPILIPIEGLLSNYPQR
jgi:hypothetical protein